MDDFHTASMAGKAAYESRCRDISDMAWDMLTDEDQEFWRKYAAQDWKRFE